MFEMYLEFYFFILNYFSLWFLYSWMKKVEFYTIKPLKDVCGSETRWQVFRTVSISWGVLVLSNLRIRCLYCDLIFHVIYSTPYHGIQGNLLHTGLHFPGLLSSTVDTNDFSWNKHLQIYVSEKKSKSRGWGTK